MTNALIKFLSKTYAIWLVSIAAVVFFIGYNAYLVDHSLVNLKVVLDKAGDINSIDDAKNLAQVLDYTLLTELSSVDLQTTNIAKIEMAKDILANLKDKMQLNDVKFLVKSVVDKKDEKRSPIMVALDNIAKIFAPFGAKFSKAQLENKARLLENAVTAITDKGKLQEAYYELGNVYSKLADFAKAKAAFQKVAEIDPLSALGKKAQFNLAWNDKFRGDLNGAEKEFERLSQSQDEQLSSFSQYQLADTYKKKGEFDKAAKLFNEVAKKYPREEFAQLATFQSGYIHLYDLQEPEKAKQVFEEARSLFGASPIVTQIEKETFGNIVEEFRKKGYAYLKEGQLLLSESLYKRADGQFDKGLEIRPQDGVSLIGKALAYLWLGDNDKALTIGRRAVEISPKDEAASVNLGYIYTQLTMPEKAVKEFKRGLRYNRKSLLGHYDLGYVYALENKLTDAVKEFRQATKIDPDYAYAYNNLGWSYWQLRKYSYAIEAFRKAVRLKPQFERAQYNLGQAYMVIGSYGEAKKAFEQIGEKSPEYGQAAIHLKQINKKLGLPSSR